MATNIDNLKSQMRKGMLEFCVLLLLQHSDAYASEIIYTAVNRAVLHRAVWKAALRRTAR